ncbi:MAG: DUF4249 family protein [Marinilabiliaceae bacterium]|nr:DUF4249 family protein [Marinilabiliaceae bacterium]
MFFVCSFISCEKPVDIDLKDEGGTVSVLSFIQPDSAFKISCSKSVSILSSNNYQFVNNCKLIIYKNNRLYINLRFPDDTIMAMWNDLRFQTNDTLVLQIVENNITVATAITIIPDVIPFFNIDTTTVFRTDDLGNKTENIELAFDINNPDYGSEFFQLVIENVVTEINGEDTIFSSEIVDYSKSDLIFYKSGQGVSSLGEIDFKGLFSTNDILSNVYRIKISLPKKSLAVSENVNTTFLIVKLYHLSDDCFFYIRSRIIANYYDGVPIFDPIKIHSNVVGGLGVFCGSSCFTDTLNISN